MTAHRIVAVGLIGALSVAGCNQPEDTPSDAPVATKSTGGPTATAPIAPPIGYACESGQTVTVQYPDTATAQLSYKNQTYPLRLSPSASGARFSGSGLEWWIASRNGQEGATLSRLGPNDDVGVAVLERCSRPSANPDLPPPGPLVQPSGGNLPVATPCRAAQLQLGNAGGDAGASNRVAIVSVLNTGTAPCGLAGYPGLGLLDAQGRPITTLRVDQNPATPAPVNVSPNGRAYFDIAWTVVPDQAAGQTSCPSVAQIALRTAGDPAPLTLPLAFAPCGARVRVNPFRSSADPAVVPAAAAASAST